MPGGRSEAAGTPDDPKDSGRTAEGPAQADRRRSSVSVADEKTGYIYRGHLSIIDIPPIRHQAEMPPSPHCNGGERVIQTAREAPESNLRKAWHRRSWIDKKEERK